MSPQEYCRQQAAQSGSSFYYSFLFLPTTQREAMMALYAFCRTVDDIVDSVQDPQVAAKKLEWWRSEIATIYQTGSVPTHPISLALQAPCGQFKLKQAHLLEIIAGMEMDLHQTRYVDDEALTLYCHRVAGVVGLLSAQIFANGESVCADYAKHLGQALQRINILRDVGEDALRGRIYLPLDLLREHGVKPENILQRTFDPALPALLKAFAQSAQTELCLALRALPNDQVVAQRAGLIMGRVYATLMQEIARSEYAVLGQKISLTPIRKLSLAWRTWVMPVRAVKALQGIANQTL